MSKDKNSYHGIISGYEYSEPKQTVTVFVSTVKKNRPTPQISFTIKKEHLCTMLGSLPIYRSDGSLDFMSLEGLRVHLNIREIGGTSYVRKIKLDSAFYFLERR